MKGILHLQSPKQLRDKLRHDLDRLKRDHVDAYAAFDFFVTARHLPEWLYPGNAARQKALFDSEVLLQVCRHIAEGSKHFEATASHHKSVKDTTVQGAAFQPGAFQSNAFQVGQLVVVLDGHAAAVLGQQIEVGDLAQRILEFWEKHPDLQ